MTSSKILTVAAAYVLATMYTIGLVSVLGGAMALASKVVFFLN